VLGVDLGVNEDVSTGSELVDGHPHPPAVDLGQVAVLLGIIAEPHVEMLLIPGFLCDVRTSYSG
jgi:hypothetical protein